ncbi:MAG: hypothetical protein K0R54_554 [Clostridiaceae bacterium]|jgi:hypothetical protein|nr:hypothetical protein [Clostridiaceae bacterium]
MFTIKTNTIYATNKEKDGEKIRLISIQKQLMHQSY